MKKSGSTDVVGALDLSLMGCCLVFPAASYRRGCVYTTPTVSDNFFGKIFTLLAFQKKRKGKHPPCPCYLTQGGVCV